MMHKWQQDYTAWFILFRELANGKRAGHKSKNCCKDYLKESLNLESISTHGWEFHANEHITWSKNSSWLNDWFSEFLDCKWKAGKKCLKRPWCGISRSCSCDLTCNVCGSFYLSKSRKLTHIQNYHTRTLTKYKISLSTWKVCKLVSGLKSMQIITKIDLIVTQCMCLMSANFVPWVLSFVQFKEPHLLKAQLHHTVLSCVGHT